MGRINNEHGDEVHNDKEEAQKSDHVGSHPQGEDLDKLAPKGAQNVVGDERVIFSGVPGLANRNDGQKRLTKGQTKGQEWTTPCQCQTLMVDI